MLCYIPNVVQNKLFNVSTFISPWFWSSTVCTLSGTILLIANLFFGNEESALFVWGIRLVTIPMALTFTAYFIVLFFDRDRLQTEDYQIARGFMTHAEQKGETAEGREALSLFMSKRNIGEETK